MMATMNRGGVVTMMAVAAAIAAGSCKKAAPPGAEPMSTGSGSAAPVSKIGAPVTLPPPSAAPAAARTTLGAKVGDDFAKAAAAEGQGTELPSLSVKGSIAAVPRAAAPALAIRGLTAAAATGFRVAYAESSNPVHENLRQAFAENRVFESVVEALNQTIRVPTSVDVQVVDCDAVNAFYDPEGKRVIVCYELMTYFAEVFRPTISNDDELGVAVIGATMFSFFHEVGHALIHLLDLPAVGREEDAADQIATLILMGDGEDGAQLALSGAYWFQLQGQSGTNETPFWDEHAFDGQRYYNILCLIYGSDPAKYAAVAEAGGLPEERAARCSEEHGRLSRAWDKMLAPHMTDKAVANVDFADPDDAGSAAPPAEPVAPTEDSPAADDAPSCEDAALQATTLLATQLEAEARKLPDDEAEAELQSAQAQLPAVFEQIVSECERTPWSATTRTCLAKAKTYAQADGCGE